MLTVYLAGVALMAFLSMATGGPGSRYELGVHATLALLWPITLVVLIILMFMLVTTS